MTQNNKSEEKQAKNIQVPLPRVKGSGLVQVGQHGCALAGGEIVWVSPDGNDHNVSFSPSNSPLRNGHTIRVPASEPVVTQLREDASGEYPYSTASGLVAAREANQPRIIIVG